MSDDEVVADTRDVPLATVPAAAIPFRKPQRSIFLFLARENKNAMPEKVMPLVKVTVLAGVFCARYCGLGKDARPQ